MFIGLRYVESQSEDTDLREVKDTEFITNVEYNKVDYWNGFLTSFYNEYEKRNMNPIANTFLLAKHFLPSIEKHAYNTIMDFLKTKTDQKTIDKYMVLL